MGTRGRGAGGVAVHNGKIYYAGGLNNGNAVKWLDVYDPEANTWTALPDMPTARDHFHAAVLDGKLWAIGGRNVQIGSTTTVNEAYSFASNTWSSAGQHAPLPTPRGGYAVGTQGDEVFVIGGEDATKAHGTVEAYNVETNQWRTVVTPMPVPRHGIQAAKCNGGLYVAAGGTAPGHNPSTAHHAFFPGGSARPCGGVVGFGKSTVAGESSNFPTTLQFGPDGRLYVAQQNGVIKAYTVSRTGANDYDVTATENINVINTMPNRDDDGTLNASVTGGRLVTGMVVTGTAANPVIYVGSSDPRIGGGEDAGENDLNLDTNSGIISKLTKPASTLGQAGPRARAAALGGEPHGQRARPQRRRQHALRRAGRQHEQGRAVEQLRGPGGVRAVGRDSLDRPAGDRQHDLRPAHPRRPDEPGRRRERPVRRQRRAQPGAPGARSPGAGLRAGIPQPVRHPLHEVRPDVQHRQRRQRGMGRQAAAGLAPRARARTTSRSRAPRTATACT